ncbi:MAG: type III secretion chaperone SycN [Mailhella sp.]|nr:type III secretion chaperone SycN [Mailhella sp.]
MLAYEIQAFGQRLGLESLALSHDGIAHLNIEGIGSFYLELEEKNGRRELLAYLSAEIPAYDVDTPRRLLEACDYRRANPMPLSAGVFSGRAILLTRLKEHEATAAGIENALRFLAEVLHA